MSFVFSRSAEVRRLHVAVRDRLRALSQELSGLNHAVGGKLELKDVDLECLDLVDRFGPLSPSALARLAGLHPATTTGVLDRLQRAGWIVRERDDTAADRRAVTVRMLPERRPDINRHYAGMLRSIQQICAGYTPEQLAVVADFLGRVAEAGRRATEELARDDAP